MFKGEALRSMLLNAFGWWKISQITYIASLIAFGLGGLTLIASLFGLTLDRKGRDHPRGHPGRKPQVPDHMTPERLRPAGTREPGAD